MAKIKFVVNRSQPLVRGIEPPELFFKRTKKRKRDENPHAEQTYWCVSVFPGKPNFANQNLRLTVFFHKRLNAGLRYKKSDYHVEVVLFERTFTPPAGSVSLAESGELSINVDRKFFEEGDFSNADGDRYVGETKKQRKARHLACEALGIEDAEEEQYFELWSEHRQAIREAVRRFERMAKVFGKGFESDDDAWGRPPEDEDDDQDNEDEPE